MAETDVKGLIERLRRRSNISRVRARGFDADAMRDAADALAALSGTRAAGEPVHPCENIFAGMRPGEKSHRSIVYSDGRQHYCERCGEKIDHETFGNIPADYVVTHDLGNYNAPAAISGTREAGEPVAWWVHEMHITRHPVKARGMGPEPTEYFYPADREEHAKDAARMLHGACTPLYAAPPAEVERGAVTDETVRLACPQCDFGIGLHEPGCGQLPAALASPTPAQQATVEDDAIAEEIVAALFKDLRDRRFLKWLFSEMPTTVAYFEDGTPLDSLDADVQDEIRAAWREIIRTALKGSNQ